MAAPIMQTPQAIAALSALAQDSRLAIYRLLVQHASDGLAASAIARRLDLANATLSFHLKELVHAGLVTIERDGRSLIYRPAIERMNGLLAYLSAHCCQGVACAPARRRRRAAAC